MYVCIYFCFDEALYLEEYSMYKHMYIRMCIGSICVYPCRCLCMSYGAVRAMHVWCECVVCARTVCVSCPVCVIALCVVSFCVLLYVPHTWRKRGVSCTTA